MSKEEKIVSDETVVDSNSTPDEKDAYVPKKAYEDVTRDMHKNKQKVRSLEADNNELKAQLKAQEEQEMQKQEKWKELFETSKAELVEVRKEAQIKDDKYTRSQKISALKQEIGVNIKDEYLSFASLDNIVLTDGLIDKDSLRDVANSFRKEHGQLFPQEENVNITGQAPNSSNVSATKDYNKMSPAELVREYNTQNPKINE